MGWPVFPVFPGEKRPRIRHGFHAASTDPSQIDRWWWRWPGAGIGVPTGKITGLVVLDIDAKEDKETHCTGFDSLEHLRTFPGYEPLPVTRTSLTGGGGLHLVYAYPFDSVGSNSTLTSTTRLGGLPGIDVRADGGYVVVPPSHHPSGNRYLWLSESSLTSYPEFLVALSFARSPPISSHPSVATDDFHQWTSLFEQGPSSSSPDFAYWHSVAERLAAKRAVPGNRNDLGFWLARKVRDAGLSRSEADAILLAYARSVPQEGHGYSEREALNSVRSAYRR